MMMMMMMMKEYSMKPPVKNDEELWSDGWKVERCEG
jgi:hypothetical protein